jgi:23S rRNA (pseudouridine1915-N3)-methyltransferase
MRLVVAVVGKARNAALGEAIRDYETRAARYWPLDVQEVREERATGIPLDKVKEREAARLSEKVPERAQTVACELGGKSLSSEQFAELLQSAREEDRDLAFLIGGAFGLSPSVAKKSTM